MLTIDPPLVLAPMVGLTDATFRRLVRRLGGVGLTTAEFVSARALAAGGRRAARALALVRGERPFAVQLYGDEPGSMAAAAAQLEALGVDVVDLNLGCPAHDIRRRGAGAGLLADLGRAREVIRACRRALPATPLTVKTRTGLDERRLTYLELGRICEAEGVDAITLHARTAAQMYRGRADWSRIARLREAVRIPVIGNGDVTTPEDAVALREQTGCAAVMIGRAALANPWIFAQAAALLAGRAYPAVTPAARRDFILEHFACIEREDAARPEVVRRQLRAFTRMYAAGLPPPTAVALRRRIGELAAPADFRAAVAALLA